MESLQSTESTSKGTEQGADRVWNNDATGSPRDPDPAASLPAIKLQASKSFS